MAASDRMMIDLDSLPQQFDMTLDGEDFTFRVYRLEANDQYYISVYDEDMVPIVLGEKMEYQEALFGSINDPRLPVGYMVPYDESGQESTVDGSNFQKSVFIFFPEDENDDDTPTEFDDDLADDEETIDSVDDDNGTDDEVNLYGTDRIVGGDDV